MVVNPVSGIRSFSLDVNESASSGSPSSSAAHQPSPQAPAFTRDSSDISAAARAAARSSQTPASFVAATQAVLGVYTEGLAEAIAGSSRNRRLLAEEEARTIATESSPPFLPSVLVVRS